MKFKHPEKLVCHTDLVDPSIAYIGNRPDLSEWADLGPGVWEPPTVNLRPGMALDASRLFSEVSETYDASHCTMVYRFKPAASTDGTGR